ADQASFHRQATLVGDAIQGRVRTLTTVAFAILGLTALAVLLAAGALARTISVPVQRLTEAVQAAEQGDLEAARQRALAVRSRDELGTLAEGFRQMAAQLQETLAGLEQQLAERRRAEEALEVEHRALQESEARYRTLFDGVPVGLYRTAPGGQVMDANPALVEMLGYPDRESLLTVNAADLYADPAERARWRALMEEKGLVRDFVVQFRRYDGELMWVNNSSRVVREAEHGDALPGRVLSYEGSLEDITERKRAEEQLRKYQERLEERVQERTAALAAANEQMRREMAERERAEEELREAKAAAEQANAAKSAFLASVSHELRTPLTSILGFAKIIDKRLGERIFPQVQADDARTQRAMGQVAENIKIVAAEAERLTALINDLLDLAKIEAGKVEWRAERVRVSELVDRAAVATSVLFVQKGLPLLREIPDDLPEIVGDRDRLVQVLINLFSNAIKFTDAGSVTCQARRAGGAIEVSVRDTGVGISEADQHKLFERFRQVGDTLTEKPQGTGLGLPICKEIVEHYGGHIWVESEPGRGSTFSFTLPIQAAATSGGTGRPRKAINIEGLIQQLEARRAGPASSRSNGRHTILIVDDDVHIRELLRQELHEAGYEVQEAGDGREALAQIRQKRPDLVVLDVMMPEMSGFDVAAVLKGDPQTMDLPIIILSIVEDQERGYRLGVDRYLTKPIETGVVLEEIERLLAQGVSRNKVMVVDEDASTLKTLTEVLRAKGYEVVEAASGDEAIEKALRARPDMIILNAVLPQQREIVKTLRFERGLEHVLFLLFD
ncbi:MAG TPA: response regulator, partial [Anaerolineae bacterium]|nr:response regulator [Anaerolineae bacterium]